MSSFGGSSSGYNALFGDAPKVVADPEEVRIALSSILQNCGSSLGKEIDYISIEKDAADQESKLGEDFMKRKVKLHALPSFEKHSDDAKYDVLTIGPQDSDDEAEKHLPQDEKAEKVRERKASISFAAEAMGLDPPKGMLNVNVESGTNNVDDNDNNNTNNNKERRRSSVGQGNPIGLLNKNRRGSSISSNGNNVNEPNSNPRRDSMSTASRRRTSSTGTSCYDETSYEMFGGDSHTFSLNYMITKWKAEGKNQFEEARYGGPAMQNARGARFERGTKTGAGDDLFSDVNDEEKDVEPAEIPPHTRMRLDRINGQKVIRHELNIGGLYGALHNLMDRNEVTLQDIEANSKIRLEKRKEEFRQAHGQIQQLRKQEEVNKVERARAATLAEVQEHANGSSLAGMADLLHMDVSQFKDQLRPRVKSVNSDDSYSDSSVEGAH